MNKQIGVVGLAVMGSNLALNIESKGYSVSVYNRTTTRISDLLENEAKSKEISGYYNIEDFVNSLEKPRKIILMVKAGKATDITIEQLLPYLDKEDLIIDGGNTFYKDTINRNEYLESKGIYFLGAGISGGEEGALRGPSMMLGGHSEAYDMIKPIFNKISAQVNNESCSLYVGPDGSGHYVKMIHNGIEYGDMQLISEIYFVLKNVLKLEAKELHTIFKNWNDGELSSYLIKITADIFTVQDTESGEHLIDVILDKAEQKGTGMWTSVDALELGIPLSTITESVFARFMSSLKEERVTASKILKGPKNKKIYDKDKWIESLRKALYMGKICSYAQGFSQIQKKSQKMNWGINLGDVAMAWRGGCIIRAQFLQNIKNAYDKNKDINNILLDDYFREITMEYQNELRSVVKLAIDYGIPVPSLQSALSYFDSYRSEFLPANLIQAQRDFFGAHKYKRIDKEGYFHTEWQNK